MVYNKNPLTTKGYHSMKVDNNIYIRYLLDKKNSDLRSSSMINYTKSKRRLMSMESQYAIDKMLNEDIFQRSNQSSLDMD